MTCNRNLGVGRSDEAIDVGRSDEAIDFEIAMIL